MKNASVTIRLGASCNEVEVDGHKFDRAAMDKQQQNKLRRMIRDAFVKEQS
jgi:hypothetical protein